MNNFSKKHILVLWLLTTLILGVQSCNEQSVPLDKSKVQFTLSTGTTSNGRGKDIDLPENARLRISIESRSGESIYSNHEIQLLKVGDAYMADPLELVPGTYVLTDFMIVKDSKVLYATPKSGSSLSPYVIHSLPYNFSISENSIANVSMQVIDVQDEKPEAFGYASFKVNIVNTLSLTVFKTKDGQTSITEATAELRQGKELIEAFSLEAAMNTIVFEGNPDAVYTLLVYADGYTKSKTFNLKELKRELGSKPLKITIEPTLFLTLESTVDEGNEYEEYFELVLEGTGAVNINWGDGSETSGRLPFRGSHEYTNGTYTAIITGDLDQITNLYGFSYSTYMSAITGLTNLTALRTFNPSWGAVPIKVDLSNCKKLETIYVEKYGAPYDVVDLRKDFKLPQEHFIKDFIFSVSGITETRGNVTADELEALVDNIYNNAKKRDIYEGKFFVGPVDEPSPDTQEKLGILQNEYNWNVGLNADIYEFDSKGGRINPGLESRRENWLRHKFPNNQRNRRSATVAFTK